jgi:hypothetical protein
MDRAVIGDDDNGLCLEAWPWTVEPVEGFQKGDEIAAAFDTRGGDGQLVAYPVKRAHHGNLFRLSRRWRAQIGPAPRPSARQIGMRERLALIGVLACAGDAASGSPLFPECLEELRPANLDAFARIDPRLHGNKPRR